MASNCQTSSYEVRQQSASAPALWTEFGGGTVVTSETKPKRGRRFALPPQSMYETACLAADSAKALLLG